jgi:hypothetical protein
MASRVFDSLTAGRGRLYPMDSGKRDEWVKRVEQYDWWSKMDEEEKTARVPHFDGFIKVDQALVDNLQTALREHGGSFRYNLEATKQAGAGGGLEQVNLTYHIAKAKPNGAAAPAAAPVSEEFEDDDIPF